jgi:hypothetical protein
MIAQPPLGCAGSAAFKLPGLREFHSCRKLRDDVYPGGPWGTPEKVEAACQELAKVWARCSRSQAQAGSSVFANTTHSGSGRSFALAASAFASFVLFPAFTVAAEERKSETIGPWTIESVFKVDRCSINRTQTNPFAAPARQP